MIIECDSCGDAILESDGSHFAAGLCSNCIDSLKAFSLSCDALIAELVAAGDFGPIN